MSEQFEFGGKLKKYLLILAVAGLGLGSLVAILKGMGGAEGHAIGMNRFWANLLLNTYYFAGISIVGLFFVAAHQLGYSGWQTVFKKIPMAMGKFLYIIFGLVVVITIGLVFDIHHIYGHWSDAAHVDAIVKTKSPFLNNFTYSVLVVGFFGLWALFAHLITKHFTSVKNWSEYSKTKKLSALFLLVFGVSQSVLSWIFIMSLDPHWYSTLFGWYNFASYACAGFAMMILIILGLKKMGHLPNVTMDHVHDLAKYLFGFTVFWTYLWFSQFLLIWYANIPEATVWYTKRLDIPLFKFIFFGGLIINFVVPFLALIARDPRRKYASLVTISVIVIFGHYLDFFQMVMVEPMAMPHHTEEHADDHHDDHANDATTAVLYAEVDHDHTDGDHDHADEVHNEMSHDDATHTDASHDHEDGHAVAIGEPHGDDHGSDAAHGVHDDHHGDKEIKSFATIGLAELLMFIGFIGLFLFTVFSNLSGKELELKEDPYLEESLHHHI